MKYASSDAYTLGKLVDKLSRKLAKSKGLFCASALLSFIITYHSYYATVPRNCCIPIVYKISQKFATR